MKGLKWQAVISSMFALVTRGMGFVVRIVLSRLLGAEALGILEMAGGVQQLLAAPLVSGLPVAVSRLTALEGQGEKGQTLHAAKGMAKRRGMAMAVLCIAAAPFAGLLLGDMRAVPAIVFFAPALPIISVCNVMDGYAFGTGRAFSPALSEFLEQVVRVIAVVAILALLPNLRLPIRAGVPVMAGVLGEMAGLIVMLIALRGCAKRPIDPWPLQKRLDRLALPMMGSRLGMSALRSATGVLLPRLLMAHGLSAQAAAVDLGKLQGMVMPLLFLPGIFTGALASLGGPQLAARKQKGKLAAKLTGLSLLVGLAGGAALYMLAPLIGEKLYRQTDLAPLLRMMAPSAVLSSLSHILSAMLMGLGRQRQLFVRQMAGGGATLLLTIVLTCWFGIYGAGAAMLLGQAVQCTLLGALMGRTLRRESTAAA